MNLLNLTPEERAAFERVRNGIQKELEAKFVGQRSSLEIHRMVAEELGRMMTGSVEVSQDKEDPTKFNITVESSEIEKLMKGE